MRTVEQEQVASAELVLPPSVQEALGELVSAAKDGLLALSVGVGGCGTRRGTRTAAASGTGRRRQTVP